MCCPKNRPMVVGRFSKNDVGKRMVFFKSDYHWTDLIFCPSKNGRETEIFVQNGRFWWNRLSFSVRFRNNEKNGKALHILVNFFAKCLNCSRPFFMILAPNLLLTDFFSVLIFLNWIFFQDFDLRTLWVNCPLLFDECWRCHIKNRLIRSISVMRRYVNYIS